MKKHVVILILLLLFVLSACTAVQDSKVNNDPTLQLRSISLSEQHKKLIEDAKAMQTQSGYGGDEYTVITLKKGTVIYGMMPGQSAWYTDKESVDKSGNSYKKLYEGMQIAPHPKFGYRTKLASYEVLGDMEVAYGKCLANRKVKSNDAEVFLGDGGYIQEKSLKNFYKIMEIPTGVPKETLLKYVYQYVPGYDFHTMKAKKGAE